MMAVPFVPRSDGTAQRKGAHLDHIGDTLEKAGHGEVELRSRSGERRELRVKET